MTFSIQEASEKLGISTYTLRYYEQEEIIPKIERNLSGHRVYKEEDLEWINFITCLKSTGMPISELKQFLKFYQSGDSTFEKRKSILISHREHILSNMMQLKESLDKINWKIGHYEDIEKQLKSTKKPKD